MSMKLSYRDKVIIIVVSVIVVLGIGIFCFAKPKYESLQVSKERLSAKQTEQQQVDDKIATLEVLKKRLEDDIGSIVEDQEQFLSEKEYGDTYKISKYLMELFAPINGFNITGVTIEPLESTELAEYFYNKNAISYPLKVNGDIANKLPPEVEYATAGKWPKGPDGVLVGGTVATVSYGCDDSAQVLDAVQLVADNDKNIYLMTFSGNYVENQNQEADAPKFSGDLTIEIYEIYPLDPEDIDAAPTSLITTEEAAQ